MSVPEMNIIMSLKTSNRHKEGRAECAGYSLNYKHYERYEQEQFTFLAPFVVRRLLNIN